LMYGRSDNFQKTSQAFSRLRPSSAKTHSSILSPSA
jgi:hypothetical protein